MGRGEHIFVAQSLRVPAQQLQMAFKVTRKGCGRGSGEAPRALKLILINRLVAAHPTAQIQHDGGDSYTLHSGTTRVAFTFRVTTAKRLTETGRPWFNVSAREIESWTAASRQLIVAECKAAESGLKVRTYVVDPSGFQDITNFETKSSEVVPSALFEVQQDDVGAYLFNLTAKDAYPKIRIPDETVSDLVLTEAEQELLNTAYSDIRERDRTVGGDFEPLVVTIDPGSAPPEEIAKYLAELSHLYHLLGGSGIEFEMVDSRQPSNVFAQ